MFEEKHTVVPSEENPMSHLQRFHVGRATGGPDRCMVNHWDKDMAHWNKPTSSMNDQPGWGHYLTFLAHKKRAPGTHRAAIG